MKHYTEVEKYLEEIADIADNSTDKYESSQLLWDA